MQSVFPRHDGTGNLGKKKWKVKKNFQGGGGNSKKGISNQREGGRGRYSDVNGQAGPSDTTLKRFNLSVGNSKKAQ